MRCQFNLVPGSVFHAAIFKFNALVLIFFKAVSSFDATIFGLFGLKFVHEQFFWMPLSDFVVSNLFKAVFLMLLSSDFW